MTAQSEFTVCSLKWQSCACLLWTCPQLLAHTTFQIPISL